jgi:hypothetical protein
VTQSELPPLLSCGPFHGLMRRIGMLSEDGYPSVQVAMLVGFGAWLLGAVLAVLQPVLGSVPNLLKYLVDVNPAAHALVALPVLIGAERFTDARLRALIGYPILGGLVAGEAERAYRHAARTAAWRSSSAIVEAAMLVGAASLCVKFTLASQDDRVNAGIRAAAYSGGALSWEALWLQIGVGTALVFLMFRWLFRSVCWALLLGKLARLPLQLVPTHPDRAGGLGFLRAYPSLFDGLTLGAGATVGAKLLNAALHDGASLDRIATDVGVWLLVVLVVTVGPLLIVWGVLNSFRDQALLDASAMAARAHRYYWTSRPTSAESTSAEQYEGVSTLNALNSVLDRATEIRPLLVSRSAVAQLLAVATLPMLPALVVQMPLSRVVNLFIGGF